MPPKACRTAYTAAFKLTVVAYAEEHGNRPAGKKFSVNERCVRNWRKGKEILETQPEGKKALRGSKCDYPIVEEKLVEWIRTRIQQGHGKNISRAMLQTKAKQLVKEAGDNTFKASYGWVKGFFHRHDLTEIQTSAQSIQDTKGNTAGEKSTPENKNVRDRVDDSGSGCVKVEEEGEAVQVLRINIMGKPESEESSLYAEITEEFIVPLSSSQKAGEPCDIEEDSHDTEYTNANDAINCDDMDVDTFDQEQNTENSDIEGNNLIDDMIMVKDADANDKVKDSNENICSTDQESNFGKSSEVDKYHREKEEIPPESVKQRRSSYTAEFKLTVVEYAEKHGGRPATRKFSVPEKCVRMWKRDKQKLLSLHPDKKALRGQTSWFPELEEMLIKWIIEKHVERKCKLLSPKMVRERARLWAREQGLPPDFKASGSWVMRFLRRYKDFDLPVRRKKTKKRKRRTNSNEVPAASSNSNNVLFL